MSLKVPVFYHSCNFTGPYTDEALKTVAKFPFVTIEKGQGVTLCASPPPHPTGCCLTLPLLRSGTGPRNYAEDKIVDTLRRVKAIDPNISTVFYYNSVLDWPFYKLHAEFLQHPDCSLPQSPLPRTAAAIPWA